MKLFFVFLLIVLAVELHSRPIDDNEESETETVAVLEQGGKRFRIYYKPPRGDDSGAIIFLYGPYKADGIDVLWRRVYKATNGEFMGSDLIFLDTPVDKKPLPTNKKSRPDGFKYAF
ncbi:unnamed protein product [Caenorhabditis brenneri]